MNREHVQWRGYWPAAPVPFTQDGAVNAKSFDKVLRMYVENGVHGILVNGTTGEWTAQTQEERRTVAEIAGDVLRDSAIPFVVGVSALRLSDSLDLGTHAVANGASGLLSTVPPYVNPNETETISYFAELTDAIDAPWMVYNWPRGTGVDHSVRVLEQIAELAHVVAIKDSTGDEVKAAQGCERLVDRVRFFARFIHRRGLAIMREFGGDGNIDGGGLGARWGVGFYEAFWNGEFGDARTYSSSYENLTDQLVRLDYSSRFGSPIPQLKAAMNLLGQPGGHVRSPLLDISDQKTLEGLNAALKRGELIVE